MVQPKIKSWRGKFSYDVDRYKNDKEYRTDIEYTKLVILSQYKRTSCPAR